MNQKIRIGLIGFGRMGGFYFQELQKSKDWEIAYICDINPASRELAQRLSPSSQVVSDEQCIFEDPSVQVVGLFTLADSRLRQVRKAIAFRKHILMEKPVADSLQHEWELVRLIESSDRLVAVNLYLRNSWYHQVIKDFVRQGEIGELAILRVCHMTPGLAPGEGHEYEGPSFHDCGMHYVDIARWYAECEYKTWHAQALKMWNYPEPWWLQCHGTFDNGVVFDITQGHVYGQLSKDQTHNSYIDVIGTKGIARMSHDFHTAVVELHGVTYTRRIEKPYGGKNIDRLCRVFARSVRIGSMHPTLPTVRDAVMASEYAWKFLENARTHALPAIGDLQTLEEIRERRRHLKNGYGLLRSPFSSLA